MLPVTERWQRGGLVAVAEYWKEFFQAEPESQVDVSLNAEEVTLSVHSCPAIAHLRRHDREIVLVFCQHCTYSLAMRWPNRLEFRFALREETDHVSKRFVWRRPTTHLKTFNGLRKPNARLLRLLWTL